MQYFSLDNGAYGVLLNRDGQAAVVLICTVFLNTNDGTLPSEVETPYSSVK